MIKMKLGQRSDSLSQCCENTDIQVRSRQTQPRPKQDEKRNGQQCVTQGLPDPAALPGAVVGGDDGLSGLTGLTGTVRAALDKSAYIGHDPIDCQRIGVQVFHDLAVEKDGEDAHGHINKEGGKGRWKSP